MNDKAPLSNKVKGSSNRKSFWLVLIGVIWAALVLAGIYFLLTALERGRYDAKNRAAQVGVHDFNAGDDTNKGIPVVTVIKASDSQVYQNEQVQYVVATSAAVDDVRMQDAQGNIVTAFAAAEDPELRTLWNITVTMDADFDGLLYPALKKGDSWYPSDKGKALLVLETAPTSTLKPAPTPIPSPTTMPTTTPTGHRHGGAEQCRVIWHQA